MHVEMCLRIEMARSQGHLHLEQVDPLLRLLAGAWLLQAVLMRAMHIPLQENSVAQALRWVRMWALPQLGVSGQLLPERREEQRP